MFDLKLTPDERGRPIGMLKFRVNQFEIAVNSILL